MPNLRSQKTNNGRKSKEVKEEDSEEQKLMNWNTEVKIKSY